MHEEEITQEPRFMVVAGKDLFDLIYFSIGGRSFLSVFESKILARDKKPNQENFFLHDPAQKIKYPMLVTELKSAEDRYLATCVFKVDGQNSVTRIYLSTANSAESLETLKDIRDKAKGLGNDTLLAVLDTWLTEHSDAVGELEVVEP